MRGCVLLLAGALLAGAQVKTEAAKGDGCAPPPGSTAPSLPAKLLEGQGTVDMPITTSNPEAQRFFNQGVAQMHSFWAREAERSFLQAAALDPEAPMPYWGIAMVAGGDWRPRFQIDGYEEIYGRSPQPKKSRALDAARKALELSGKPGKATDVEKMYIAATWARRNPEAKQPIEDFVKALRALLAKYPKEVEARTDLSLMLMRGFTLPAKTPRSTSMEAVSLLRDLLKEAPDHPGVHHYVIHGWEGSAFAKEAWPSSEKYGKLVTNIPHALHMPGHIWSQTGRWEDGIKAFQAAAENERSYMKADSLYGSGHHGHNVHYLSSSYSFSGNYEKAIEAARELLAIKENPREASAKDNFTSAYAQGWIAMMRTLVQFQKWDELIEGKMLPEIGRARQQAWRHWAIGVAQAAKGNLPEARREALAMSESLRLYERATRREVPEELRVAQTELAGHLLVAEGKIDKGLKRLESASAGERRLRYTEPPYYPRPVAESLGHLALRHGKGKLAEQAYRTALDQYPADHHAQSGLKAAVEAQKRATATGL